VTVSVFGLAPLGVIVIVRPSAPPGEGLDGGDPEPPHLVAQRHSIARLSIRPIMSLMICQNSARKQNRRLARAAGAADSAPVLSHRQPSTTQSSRTESAEPRY
jgi:hypothetical protein